MDKRTSLLAEWYAIAEQLKATKGEEAALRKEVFSLYFENPAEGVNEVALGGGFVLKGTYKLTRNLDEAVLPAVFEKLPPGSEDKLISYTPRLVLDAYRGLPAGERKIFEQALIIAPGMPTLAIEASKEKRKRGGK